MKLSRWSYFPLFYPNLASSGEVRCPGSICHLHEIRCVSCNLRVGYILVLAFIEDPSHEVLAVSLAMDSSVAALTMKRA